jgi:iron complex transport system substrate-binding protein
MSRRSERAPRLEAGLIALAGAVAISVGVVARFAPASLLALPDRPTPADEPRVRTEGLTFPRHATGADDVRVAVAGRPGRLASQHWSTDEFLYSVVPPDRVVGVSDGAWQHGLTNVLALVERHRPVRAMDLELLLKAGPDLVFTPDAARSDHPALLRLAGLPVYRIHTNFRSIASIEDHVRLVGYLSGEDARAHAEVERMRAAVRRAVAMRPADITPPRVLGLGGTYSYGAETLFHDIVQTLGAENLAASHGLTGYDRVADEEIVLWDPDWIVAGADRGSEAAVGAALLARPAIRVTSAGRNGRIVVLPNHVFLPLSPFVTHLVEAMAMAFYGGSTS